MRQRLRQDLSPKRIQTSALTHRGLGQVMAWKMPSVSPVCVCAWWAAPVMTEWKWCPLAGNTRWQCGSPTVPPRLAPATLPRSAGCVVWAYAAPVPNDRTRHAIPALDVATTRLRMSTSSVMCTLGTPIYVRPGGPVGLRLRRACREDERMARLRAAVVRHTCAECLVSLYGVARPLKG
jgi:hypothetical protein